MPNNIYELFVYVINLVVPNMCVICSSMLLTWQCAILIKIWEM